MRALSMVLFASYGLTVACDDPAEDVPAAEVHAAEHAEDDHGEHADDEHEGHEEHAEDEHEEHTERIALQAGPDSTIGFTGSKVTGSHDGGFSQWRGVLELDREHLSASALTVTIDMGSVFTDEDDLTEHLRSADFFDVERFPTATFTSSRITEGGEGDATHTITGDLTLHGVTKTISFPAKVNITDGAIEATSEFSINRRDFDINYPGRPNDLIRDGVVIKLHIRAPRAAAQAGHGGPEAPDMAPDHDMN